MSTIADQLAGALREAMEWDWITDAENIAPIVVAQCDAALSAYEASRTAPAVREVNSDDELKALSAYYDSIATSDGLHHMHPDRVAVLLEATRAALNSFRDRVNGESS